MVDVDSRTLERFVFEFALGLLERISSGVLKLLVAELTPSISCSVSSLRLESVVSSILWNVADLLFVDSGKKFLRTVIFSIHFDTLLALLILSLIILLFWCFNLIGFLDFWLGFFWLYFLRSYRFFGLFILQLKLLLRIQIWWINGPFDFGLFFLFLNLFLLFLWLWCLLFRLTGLRGWLFFLDLFFRLLVFFWNDNFWLLFLLWLLVIIVEVLKSFWLLELTGHPPLCWCRLINSCWNFRWFWFCQRWMFWWDGFCGFFRWLWCLFLFLRLFVLRFRFTILVILQYFFVFIDVLF